MAINKVTFNGVDFWEDIGATLVEAPNYPMPAEVKELVKIKGANGTLTEATGYFNNLELDLHFRCITNFGTQNNSNFATLKRFINKTFNNISDNRLQFGDNPNKYYKVKTVEVGTITKLSDYEVDFEANFICDPFLYSTQEKPVTSTGTIKYNGDIPNTPIISFIASSSGEYTITTNGRQLTFNVDVRGKRVEINANPYSIVTLDGAPVETKGTQPIFTPTSNTLSIGGAISGLKILKNERYLG